MLTGDDALAAKGKIFTRAAQHNIIYPGSRAPPPQLQGAPRQLAGIESRTVYGIAVYMPEVPKVQGQRNKAVWSSPRRYLCRYAGPTRTRGATCTVQ